MQQQEPIAFCPACQTVALSLCGSVDADVVIDRCGSCHGLWFDSGELRAFLQSEDFTERFIKDAPVVVSPSASEVLAAEADRQCPRCPRCLDQIALADVTADLCLSCWGVWLDAGELALLVRAADEHHLDGDDSSLAHEIREGLSDINLNPNLLQQVFQALKDLLRSQHHRP